MNCPTAHQGYNCLLAYQSQKELLLYYFFIFQYVVWVSMQPKKAHHFLTENAWYAQEEVTVTLKLPTVAFSVNQDSQQPWKEASIAQIAKVVI